MFLINFDELAKQLIQFEKIRKPKVIALIRSYLEALKVIWDDLITFHDEQKTELAYDCQVGLLELMLNRHFAIAYDLATRTADIAAESIISVDNSYLNLANKYIYRDGDIDTTLTIYKDVDAQPVVSLYRDEDYQTQYDFLVKCPTAITLDEAGTKEIEALVNKVNKGRMKYSVVNY